MFLAFSVRCRGSVGGDDCQVMEVTTCSGVKVEINLKGVIPLCGKIIYLL